MPMPTTDSPQSTERPTSQHRSAGSGRGVGTLTIRIMLAVRVIYLCELLVFVQARDWGNLVFYGAIFLGSLVIPLLGRLDAEYYRLDIFVMLVFSMGPVFTSFKVWPAPVDLRSMILGNDKPLHIAGGACLAMFAAIALRKHVFSTSIYYMLTVVFALALGAAWEIFEWFSSILPHPFRLRSSGYGDSMLDMVADTVGGIIMAAALKILGYHKRLSSRGD